MILYHCYTYNQAVEFYLYVACVATLGNVSMIQLHDGRKSTCISYIDSHCTSFDDIDIICGYIFAG